MEVDPDRDGTETDWLANSADGYGVGYTKEQALAAMARYVSPPDEGDDIIVTLIEHVGDVTMRMYGTDMDVFVQGERVTIPADEFNELHDTAIEANGAANAALDAADSEPLEPEGGDGEDDDSDE